MSPPELRIADKLIDAAYERFGRPGEGPGGDYIAEVVSKADVRAHFLGMARLALAPRSYEIFDAYNEAAADQDADCVMRAGLDQLLTDSALPADERQTIEQIEALETWFLDEHHRRDMAIQDKIWKKIEGGRG